MKPLFDGPMLQLGVYSPLEVLKMVTEATPQFIFPERQIGLLRDGYEASFLVYSGDPLTYLAGGAPGFPNTWSAHHALQAGVRHNGGGRKAP